FTVLGTAKLSGTVRVTGMTTLPNSTSVIAVDLSGPAATSFVGCAFPPTSSTTRVDPGGAYQMLLASGRTYSLSLLLPVLEGTTQIGSVLFPNTQVQQSMSSDTTFDFNVPALPGVVTL